MKKKPGTRISEALILCFVFLLLGSTLSAQEPEKPTSSGTAAIQQNQENRTSGQEKIQQQQNQKKSGELQQNQKQVSNVKKVKDSSPDLTRKRGARPPSISRPTGNVMPKGAGKPAGAIRPGRR